MVSKGIKRKRNDTVKRKKQSATKCLDISTEKKFNGYLTRSKRSRLASIEVTVKVPLTRNFVHLFILCTFCVQKSGEPDSCINFDTSLDPGPLSAGRNCFYGLAD